MKILLATFALCVILCRARAGSRRNAVIAHNQPQNGLINEGTHSSSINQNPDYNMVRYQSSVITGRLSVSVEEIMSYVLENLRTLKDVFDSFGWTTLSEYLNKVIDYLNEYENKVPTNVGSRTYGRRFFGSGPPPPPPRPCELFDTRPQCTILGYGR